MQGCFALRPNTLGQGFDRDVSDKPTLIQSCLGVQCARCDFAVDLMNLAGDVAALNDWNATQLAQLEDLSGLGKRGRDTYLL